MTMSDDNITTITAQLMPASPSDAGTYNCSVIVNGTLVDSDAFELFVISKRFKYLSCCVLLLLFFKFSGSERCSI